MDLETEEEQNIRILQERIEEKIKEAEAKIQQAYEKISQITNIAESNTNTEAEIENESKR